MPVRKIPRYGAQKNIGKFSSVKTGRVAWYESLLERDYMYLLDFDPCVTFWHEQPLRLRYTFAGKTHFYKEPNRGQACDFCDFTQHHQTVRIAQIAGLTPTCSPFLLHLHLHLNDDVGREEKTSK